MKKCFIKNNARQIIIGILIIYYLFQTVYFAVNIKEHVIPDEVYHYGLIQEYSKVFLKPLNSDSTYIYGEITRINYLYHFIFGKVLHLNIFPISDLIFLRLVNIGLSLTSLWIGYKTVSILTKNKITRLLFFVIATNTLMFVFLSSGVNYDNLAILISSLVIYYSILFIKTGNVEYLLYSTVFGNLGMLTKLSLVPLILFNVLALLFFVVGQIDKIKIYFLEFNYKKFFIIGSVIISSYLVFSLYVFNLVKYRNIFPKCDQILTRDQCSNNYIYSRNIVLRDKFNASGLEPSDLSNRLEYIPQWIIIMVSRTYGIMGHLMMERSINITLIFTILSLSAFIYEFCLAVKYKNRFSFYMFFLVISYALVLMFYINYKAYIASGLIGLAVQGRYLFPLYIPIYYFISRAFTDFRNKYISIISALLLGIFFIVNCFVYFIYNDFSKFYSE